MNTNSTNIDDSNFSDIKINPVPNNSNRYSWGSHKNSSEQIAKVTLPPFPWEEKNNTGG